MGIPKLIQTLQPCAERAILGQSSGDNEDESTRSTDSDLPPIPNIASVVIDGPSLVYHVYHRLLSFKVSFLPSTSLRLHPLQCQPSYAEINQAVLAFINYLHSHHGVEVEGLYFDGALPSSKRNVRLTRLEDARRKLVDLRRLQPDLESRGEGGRNACPTLFLYSGSDGEHEKADVKKIHAEALFRLPLPLPAVFKSLPPPPFMVPAVMEYLRSCLHPLSSETLTSSTSSGKSVPAHPTTLARRHPTIQTVPGEADTHCAAQSQHSGAAILTSDSDLLAYDLGLDGSVILLTSLELSTCPTPSSESGFTQQVLLGTRYHARSLSERMSLTCNLQRFCFERSLDPSVGTSELKLRCRKGADVHSDPNNEEEYQEFLRQYSTDDLGRRSEDGVDQKGSDKASGGKISKLHLQGLDPRLAELVVQCQFDRLVVHDRANIEADAFDDEADEDVDAEKVLHMYLPFLLENPTRDSAWGYGIDIRCLAYSILASSLTSAITEKQYGAVRIHEHQRRGARIAGVPIDVSIRIWDVHSLARRLQQSLTEHRDLCSSSGPTLPPSCYWKSFALKQVAEQRRQDGRAAVDTGWSGRYLTPQNFPCVPGSWDDVHLQASVNAVLYSLRMLSQIVVLTIRSSSADQPSATVRALLEALEGLPAIAELMVAEVVKTGQRKENGDDERDLVDQALHKAVHQQFSQPQKNGGSESHGQSAGSSTENCVGKGLCKRAKRRTTNSEHRQGRREKTVAKKKVARTQGTIRGSRNMFAALEEAGE